MAGMILINLNHRNLESLGLVAARYCEQEASRRKLTPFRLGRGDLGPSTTSGSTNSSRGTARESRPGFTKATVSAWRVSLEARGLGSISISAVHDPLLDGRRVSWLGVF